jgi:hypothetical protein
MKKNILFIIVFFGILPLMHKGKLSLINTDAVYADTYAQEDCDSSDPNGDCYCDPNDPNGDCYDDPCKDGYSDNYATTTSLSGNITTTIKTWDNYDGCDNYLGQGTDDPGVDCGISDASISVSPNSGNYGDAVLLTARANIVGSTALHYEIQQSSDGGNSWDDVGNDSGSNSFSYKIDEYGENDFRVIVSCDCSISVTSASQSFMAAPPDCGIKGPPRLILSSNTGNMHDEILLTAVAKKSGTPSSLTYNFQVLDNGVWNDQGTSTDSTYSYSIDEAYTQFRVITTAVCNGVTTQDNSLTKDFTVSNPDVTLIEDETSGKPGDNVRLTANVTNVSSLTNVQYTFQVFYHNFWYEFDSQGGNFLDYDTKVMGHLQFRVRITYDGAPSTPVVSNTVDYYGAFCADDFQTQYAAEMNTAWTTTQTDATNNHGTLYEVGFQGTYDGSQYSSASTPLVTNPCGTQYDVTNSTSAWPSGANPVTGEMNLPYILGQFHTHPPVQWCSSSVHYAQGPSCIDLGTCAPPGGHAVDPTTLPFPMVVRTYVGTVSGGTSVNAQTIDTAYGNSCTNY